MHDGLDVFEISLELDDAVPARLNISARSSTHGEATARVVDPFRPPSLEDLCSRPTDHRALVALGADLYANIFVGAVEQLWHRAYGAASTRSDRSLRLRLRTEDAETASWPLELLHVPGLHTFPSTLVKTPLTRYLPVQQTFRPTMCPWNISMLAVVPTLPGPNLTDELSVLTQLEASSDRRLSIDFVSPPVTLSALRDQLRKKDYQLLHFAGHGAVLDGESVIYLEGTDQLPAAVSAAAFAHLLGPTSIRAVILKCCDGAKVIGVPTLEGMAAQLVRHGIGAVVGIQSSIRLSLADAFTRELYAALADPRHGGQIETAVSRARSALFQDAPHRPDFALPVLFLRAHDGRLWWPPASPRAARDASTPARPDPAESSRSLEAPAPIPAPESPIEQEVLRRLNVAFRGGRGVILLGESVGRASHIPTTGELTTELQRRSGGTESDWTALATLYARQHGERELRKLLLTLLDDWNHPLSIVHQLIARLPVPVVVTTGVDRLLEEACRRIRQPYSVFLTPTDVAYGRSDWLTILKLRGTLEHPRTLRIGRCEVDELARDPDFARGFDSVLSAERHVVAVGLRAEDPCFELLTRHFMQDDEMPPPVSLHTCHDEAEACRAAGWTALVFERGASESAEGKIALMLGRLADLPPDAIPRQAMQIERRRNPFRRLEAYRQEDEQLLIGRAEDCSLLLATLDRYRALLLFGDSGVGKTSFLQAAVLPEFQRRHGADRTRLETVAGDLAERWPDLLPSPASAPGLIVLDQFERFFDPGVESESRRRFLLQTLQATQDQRPDLRILLTLRRDRLADLHPFKSKHPGLYHHSIELNSLDAETARTVLVSHFAVADYRLPETVAQHVVERTQLDGASFLPALQLYGHAMFEAAETARLDGRSLDDAFRDWARAGSRDALEEFVDECLTIFVGGDLHSTLIRVLRQLTLYSRRQQIRRSALSDIFPDVEAARAVIRLLEDQRMVRFVPERNAYELVHDALVDVLESGPLALEANYSRSELRVLLLDETRRSSLSEAQWRGLLRYCLRRDLPCQAWLLGLEAAGHDPVAELLERSRDSDAQVATGALKRLAKLDSLARIEEDNSFRRYLSGTIHDTLYEIEPLEKGRAAGQLMARLGWDGLELQAMLDFVDPYRHLQPDDELPVVRATTDRDRELIRQLLPGLLSAIEDSDLERFAATRALVADEELGEEGVARVIVELGRRGMVEEVVRRLRGFSIENDTSEDAEIDDYYVRPLVLLRVLARLPHDVAPVDELDAMRHTILYGFQRRPIEAWAADVAVLLRQVATRQPDAAMSRWLMGFPAFYLDPVMGQELSAVAKELVTTEAALELMMLRIDSTQSLREQRFLMDIVLDAQPGPTFAFLETKKQSALGTELTAGLLPVLNRSWPLHGRRAPSAEDLREDLAALSPLALWREGRDLATRDDLTLYRRWQGLLRLALWALLNAAWKLGLEDVEEALGESIDRTRPDAPTKVDQLYRVLQELGEQRSTDTSMPRSDDLEEAIDRALGLLDRGALDDLADGESMRQWLNVLRVHLPDLHMSGFWPPMPDTKVSYPAILNTLREADRLDLGSAQATIFADLRSAFDAWIDAAPSSWICWLEVHLWLKNRAAELAAKEGHARYASWFKATRWTVERRDESSVPLSRSRQRWGWGRRWPECPWWLLCLDEEGEIPDDDDLIWLMEDVRDVRPDQLDANVCHMICSVVLIPFVYLSQESRLGHAFEAFSRGPWKTRLAQAIELDDLRGLLDYEVDAVVRAGLSIWAESDHEELLPQVADLALGRSGPLKDPAVDALDRWSIRHRWG